MKQPTAYAMFRDGEYYDAIHPDEYDKTAGEYDIPLYTHSADLTDEEIEELANKYLYVLNDVPYANDIKDFARAILVKAQEK
jgi:hypothetical protein